ncbi:PEP-CTERM sorting domain-containing protein [Rubellicoccus peritrichatus]|uniref:PEP-CTERM sorting domain-containing protein n=1 Tax=Rubellicoccus peritrichatus TaxID=3080537 RepID=A0AAQ3LAW7_9BACT|nr:PEP-CTERM sorting domain-containing protein [Puniceicoccus sp. CR14]WOO42336.1 PEP-CTERM sorting domain-containing protein [Puniceicoccus sp. CR14]
MNKQITLITALLSGITTALAGINVDLPGTSQEEAVWENLIGTNYPTSAGYNSFFTNTNGWTTPISASSGSATFDKVAGGGGYPASSSIYNFDTAGSFFIADTSPIAGLETVVFQTDMVGAFSATNAPVLSYNGGTQDLVADYTAVAVGDFAFGADPSTIFAFQWDLSGLGSITDYTIEWGSIAHSANFAMQLNTSNGSLAGSAIPEPSTYGLILGSLCLGILVHRRRR